MGLADNEGILLAGSLMHRGEEGYVLKAFCGSADASACQAGHCTEGIAHGRGHPSVCSAGFKVTTRTTPQLQACSGADVVILDTIGELGKVYSIGDVVYVGGSLIPHGGHNIFWSRLPTAAIIVGHYMFNFKDTHALFRNRDACITVNNGLNWCRKRCVSLMTQLIGTAWSRKHWLLCRKIKGHLVNRL